MNSHLELPILRLLHRADTSTGDGDVTAGHARQLITAHAEDYWLAWLDFLAYTGSATLDDYTSFAHDQHDLSPHDHAVINQLHWELTADLWTTPPIETGI